MAKKTAQQTAEQIDRIAGKVVAKSSQYGSEFGTVSIGQDRTEGGMTYVARQQSNPSQRFGPQGPSTHLAQGAGSFTQRRDVTATPSSSQPLYGTHYGTTPNVPRDHAIPEGDVRSMAAQTFSRIRAAQRGGGGSGRGDVPHFSTTPPRI